MKVAWLSTALTLASYFGLMLLVALSPATVSQAIGSDGTVTVGILLGILIIIVLIVIAVAFTIWNNKVDERA